MTFTINFHLWMVPSIITIIALFWALFMVKGYGGTLSGLSNIFALVPALAISLMSWIFYVIIDNVWYLIK